MVRAEDISGQRLVAHYQVPGNAEEAAALAEEIAIEQTVEFPSDLVTDPVIRAEIFGRIESVTPVETGGHELRISYAAEIVGTELPQLLNVLFGNISLKRGIRLVDFTLPPALLALFRGPRFGRVGLRGLLDEPDRPLLCTALKPMGLDPGQLADMAYDFARGGIDLIKDDHGLADQRFCPFEARVECCAAAVARAREETGRPCLYFPNITGPADVLAARARFARDAGAGGVMLAPGLVGYDAMRAIAGDDGIGLPVLLHPALLGAFSVDRGHGIAYPALFGLLARLAGADAAIFPTYGGRFAYPRDECHGLAEATRREMGALRPIFPVPAGGITVNRVPELLDFYGREVILLIGGDLHRHPEGLTASCRDFRRLVEGG